LFSAPLFSRAVAAAPRQGPTCDIARERRENRGQLSWWNQSTVPSPSPPVAPRQAVIHWLCPAFARAQAGTHACRHAGTQARTHPVKPEEAALVLGCVLYVECRGDSRVEPAAAHRARRCQAGRQRRAVGVGVGRVRRQAPHVLTWEKARTQEPTPTNPNPPTNPTRPNTNKKGNGSRDGEVGGVGAELPARERHDSLEEERGEEHLGAHGLPLRGAGGDGGEDFPHHVGGPEGGVRGGGGGEGAQQLQVGVW
jgi:hypothetical protein